MVERLMHNDRRYQDGALRYTTTHPTIVLSLIELTYLTDTADSNYCKDF
ncbi:hypothetical protein WKK05_10760 [Nostoc sp. UHCC 0302]